MNWEFMTPFLIGWGVGLITPWVIAVVLDLLTNDEFNRRIHDDEGHK